MCDKHHSNAIYRTRKSPNSIYCAVQETQTERSKNSDEETESSVGKSSPTPDERQEDPQPGPSRLPVAHRVIFFLSHCSTLTIRGTCGFTLLNLFS